ncbi:12720_t:CDS:2, partial [Racocetra persica]
YTNARHPNGAWVKMTSLIKDYLTVKRNDGFFILKDETRVLSIDEHENCLKYDKDVIFLNDEFFCNEIVHVFDLETTVFTQGNDPVPLGVICLLDTGTNTLLRYESEEKIKERIWKMVNDITKFQKVDPETIRTMVKFSEKNYEEMVKGEHEAILFAKIQDNIKPHVIIGHNSNGFDTPFIMRRLEWLGSTMMEEFYRIAPGEDAIEYTYIKFDGTLFWDSMTIFQHEFPGRQSSLNYMLDTLEIPSKIGLSYRRIDEIVLLAIETAKIQDEITKLN